MELKERVINAGRYLNARDGEDAVTILNIVLTLGNVTIGEVHKLFPNDRLLLSQVQGDSII